MTKKCDKKLNKFWKDASKYTKKGSIIGVGTIKGLIKDTKKNIKEVVKFTAKQIDKSTDAIDKTADAGKGLGDFLAQLPEYIPYILGIGVIGLAYKLI